MSKWKSVIFILFISALVTGYISFDTYGDVYQEYSNEQFKYHIKEDNTIMIYGYNSKERELTIPDKIDGKK